MGFEVYRELFIVYSTWILFLVFSSFCAAVRNIFWILNGTQWRLLQNQKPEYYEECAHVTTILFRHHIDQFMEPRLVNYITVHDRFVHPEFVLRDDVSMLTITDSKAIFVQQRKGTTPPFHHNFIITGQWETAEKIITIPLNQFHRLAESVKRDDAKIIFLQNQARCGGTLVTNIFLETNRCVTFNEPAVINALCKYTYIDEIWDKKTAARTFRNAINMMCKPYRGFDGPTLAYVIKPTVTSVISTDLIQEYIPEAIQIFIYRQPVNVAISLRRLACSADSLKMLYHLQPIPNIVAPALRSIGHSDVPFRGWSHKSSKDLELGYRCASFSMHYYLRYREKGVPIVGMKYEDLVAHRQSIVTKLFETCQLPTNLVTPALEALKKDSQAKMAFSMASLKKLMPEPPKVTTGFLQAAREMAKEFDVPGPDCWEDDFRLPGTLEP